MTAGQPQRAWTSAAALRLAMALLAIELACTTLFVQNFAAIPTALHAATSLAALALVWRRGTAPNAPSAILRMTALLLPFLGPVAAAAAVAALLIPAIRGDAAPDATMWHDHLFPNLAADPLAERMDAISRRQPAAEAETEIESFYDVLRWGTLQEQEHVLALISRSFRPEFAPVLRAGLAVADLGLRAQAAAGLSLLEARTSTAIGNLQQTYRGAGPDARSEAAIPLAHALSNAAHSGLYDELRTEEMRREIVAMLAPLVEAGHGDPALPPMLGRTLIQLGELDRAVAALEAGAHVDATFPWLVEGLFRQGDHARLADLLAQRRDQVRALIRADGPLAPALKFWAEVA